MLALNSRKAVGFTLIKVNKVSSVLIFRKRVAFCSSQQNTNPKCCHIWARNCVDGPCLTIWSSQVHDMFPICNEVRAYYKHMTGL